EIISSLCKTNQQDLVEQARMTYSSLTSCPLMRVWENALAGMSEAHKKSMLKYALSQSILYLVKIVFKKIHTLSAEESQNLQDTIDTFIQRRAHYLFDASHIRETNFASQGAFVLYDAFHEKNVIDWKRIDNEKDFKRFINSIVEELAKTTN